MSETASPDPPDGSAQLQEILRSGVDKGVPGLSAAVGNSKGIVWSSTAGYTDIQKGVALNHTHTLGVGSITKVFVAVVVLQLAEEKLLHLSDAVPDHLEESVYHGIGHAKEATIEALLGHRSGIESWEDDPRWIVDGRGRSVDTHRLWGKQDTLQYVRRPSKLDRGVYAYANTNYTLLGLIIERVTGRTSESEVRRRILEPLDLNNTFLEGFEERKGVEPRRYHWATKTFLETAGVCPKFTQLRHQGQDLIDASGSNLSVSWEAGGMLSTPTDIVRFATALRDGKLLDKTSMRLLYLWHPIASGENSVGLFRNDSETGSGKWIGHNGGVLGFTAAMWWAEEGDCVICVLANVGNVHAGKVPWHAGNVALQTGFQEIAKRVAA